MADENETEQLEPLDDLIQPDSAQQPPDSEQAEPTQQQEEQQQPPAQSQAGDERDYEAEARKMGGWKPKEEWDGPPEKWVDAKTFVERGETNPGILRQRVDKLDKTLAQERAEAQRREQETQKHLDGMRRTQKFALERQREQFTAQIEAVKQQAARDGDPELYNHARQQEQQAQQAWAQEDKQLSEAYPQPQQQQQQAPPPHVADWLERNPWYQQDQAMQQIAIGIEQDLLARAPGLSEAERLEKVSQRVREVLPDRFGGQQQQQQKPQANGQANGQARRQGSPVESAQRMAGPQNSASGRFGELPGDAKREYKALVEAGDLKDDARTRKDYAEVYFNPNVDKERAIQ